MNDQVNQHNGICMKRKAFALVNKVCTFVFLTLLFVHLATSDLRAQSSVDTQAPKLDTNLTDAEFKAMLGRLSDEQVRDVLIAEFAARRVEQAGPSEGMLTMTRNMVEALTTNAKTLFSKWPEFGGAFMAVADRLAEAGGVGFALLALLICSAVGLVARYFWRRRGAERQMAIAGRHAGKGAYASLSMIGDAALILLIELSSAIAFALAAMATLYLFFKNPDLRIFVSSYIAVIAVVLTVRSFVAFIFPLSHPMFRLIAIDDKATRLVYWVAVGLSAIWMIETMTSDLMAEFGAPAGTPDLFSMVISLVWISSALIGIYVIHRATADIAPPKEETGFANLLARNWALLIAIVQIVTWIIFTGGSLVAGNVDVVAGKIFWCMQVFIGFWMMYRILVHYLRARDFDIAIKAAIARVVQAFLFAGGFVIILGIWGVDPTTLAAGGTSGRAVQAGINVVLTGFVGWAIWDFIRTIIDVRTAAEQPDTDEEESSDAEGGLGASRAATLLPLLRSVALATIGMVCLFTALSSMGVNVGPLVAGAGVIGLAVGFGAQTLVKDIVSGVFFLIDDAFRRDEYIDLGTVKGTVERISIRSLQLRHHRGAVHTIPFGDIAALTNYSRDWVIMKLPLRLTFDTDPQQVKKILKRIGAELMEDEELSEGLLEPPKSQGVIQMEDSAMILRVKFKAIPGKQFVIRRELLHRIRAAFEEAGIRFASREVTVRVNDDDGTETEYKEAAAAAAAARTIEAEQQAT